jgi:GT2 family glycosyltransferase
MPPRAAIVIPTRHRARYLDVALASIAPQASEAGAEIVVIDDGPDSATRAVAGYHGARYVAHDGPRGLNVARNTAIDATSDAGLLVYVDDDVAVRTGWLPALLRAADECPLEVGVFTGPIRARIEGHRYRACGREGPPITTLDLGPGDTDTARAWGANMAIRRGAIDAVGRFAEHLSGGGDEEEWQARWLARGGRIRYIAAAALDHRRAGDDARLRSLARAAYHRGRASRRFDALCDAAPPLRAELRVLAGCAAHGPRFRCFNGVTMTAQSLGRLRGALERPPAPATDDFLSGASGTVGGRRGALRRALDAWLDGLEAVSGRRARLARAAAAAPARRRVLVLGIERPGMIMDAARAELRRSRHVVEIHTAPPGDRGKFENLNALLAAHPPDGFDWLLVVDDDVALPDGFLDCFLHVAEAAGLRLAQPAHRLHSHAAWAITRRRPGVAARRTTFVEIGPVTAFHRDTFATLLPLPALRMGWGLDAHWAAVAREHGWPIGIVDATPVGHTIAPVGARYGRDAAIAEARAFLAGRPYVRRDEVRTLQVHR